jgi:hypothetical protein
MSRFGTLPFDHNGQSAPWFHQPWQTAKKNAKEKELENTHKINLGGTFQRRDHRRDPLSRKKSSCDRGSRFREHNDRFGTFW